MGIDDAKGRGLEAQMQQHAHENAVLVDIGKIAGVKRMAIVHEPSETRSAKSAADQTRAAREPPDKTMFCWTLPNSNTLASC
jgi:hypothetical protein